MGLLSHASMFSQLFTTLILLKFFDAVSAGLVVMSSGDELELNTKLQFIAHVLAAPLGLLLARTFVLSSDAPTAQVTAFFEALTSGTFVFSAFCELFSEVFVDWRRRGRKFIVFSLGVILTSSFLCCD